MHLHYFFGLISILGLPIMASTTHQPIFKVYFQGALDHTSEDLSLTFYSLQEENIPIDYFPTFLREYNDLERKKKTQTIENLKEVIPFGSASKASILQFYVVIFTQQEKKQAPTRTGFLIGNRGKNGYQLVGIWPYQSHEVPHPSSGKITSILKAIIKKPENFSDLLLVA
jgi:hypothetical protein